MSADNGIYILRTRDQYRVARLSSIDRLYWSYIDGSAREDTEHDAKPVPTRVVELWGGCRYTRDAGTALRLAYGWERRLPDCEYGVRVITYNKTWKHILLDAGSYAKKEIGHIAENGQACDLEELKRIADGYYLKQYQHICCGNRFPRIKKWR